MVMNHIYLLDLFREGWDHVRFNFQLSIFLGKAHRVHWSVKAEKAEWWLMWVGGRKACRNTWKERTFLAREIALKDASVVLSPSGFGRQDGNINKDCKKQTKEKSIPTLIDDWKYSSCREGYLVVIYKMFHFILPGEEEQDSKNNTEEYWREHERKRHCLS